MSSTTDAQRLIAVSLGKIALSRQQRGGINLHKNLLVASVLHKARTTYMMDNFQTLLANKRAQAEREAAAKMIVDTPKENTVENTDSSTSCQSRGFTDCNKGSDCEVPHGERPERNNNVLSDKENILPAQDNSVENVENICDKSKMCDKKSSPREVTNNVPIITGKLPLSQHNGNTSYVSQLTSCRCAGGKRRRSFVDSDSVTEPKKPRIEEGCESSDSEESDYESDSTDSGDCYEKMQTESSQVKNLVDIFSTGFNGLCKDADPKQGQINVYVSADRPLSGHQYVLTDISCGTQIKDSVAMPQAIALAV